MSKPASKHRKNPLHGWINFDKPYDMGSTEAVTVIKRLLHPEKIGHAGTLDPLATGILPLALGEATKTSPYMMDATKDYSFTICFGEQRDTDDKEGNITVISDIRPDDASIRNILSQFTGNITQLPPIFSAVKINGQRAYDLARAGHEVTVKPRVVNVLQLEMLQRIDDNHVSLKATCGKGTYIRSLARDISLALGTVGHIAALRRTRVGIFDESTAISLDELQKYVTIHTPEEFQVLLQPIECGLDDIPAVTLDHTQAQQLRHGQGVMVADALFDAPHHLHDDVYKARYGNKVIALVRRTARHIAPLRVFNV
jgi:tRNA pseudouridine55 synthase